MASYLEGIARALLDPFEAFVLPSERVYAPLLLLSVLLSLWALRRGGFRRAWRTVFDRQVWWHPSARADYQLLFAKALIAAALWPTAIGGATLVAAAASTVLIASLGEATPRSPGAFAVGAFSVLAFVANDFARFHIHRTMHRIPRLWQLHQVHHSAETLTPLTLYRTHPVEAFFNGAATALAVGLVSGVFYYAYGSALRGWEILGVGALGFLFNAAGANLRHSVVWWSWGRLERWLISPAQHQLHHSTDPSLQNRNYGASLALWDRLYGSLRTSPAERPHLRFGVAEGLNHGHTVGSMLLGPLRAMMGERRQREARQPG